jgi:membrane-bound inhibitor of C-type lysozyme
MKVVIVLLILTAFISACNFVITDDISKVSKATFICTDGQLLSVHIIHNKSTAILVQNGKSIELQQKPTGSGFMYSSGANSIRGKGNNLTVEIGRETPLHCTSN